MLRQDYLLLLAYHLACLYFSIVPTARATWETVFPKAYGRLFFKEKVFQQILSIIIFKCQK